MQLQRHRYYFQKPIIHLSPFPKMLHVIINLNKVKKKASIRRWKITLTDIFTFFLMIRLPQHIHKNGT